MNDDVLTAIIGLRVVAASLEEEKDNQYFQDVAKDIRIVLKQLTKFPSAIDAVLAEADTYDGEYADGYRDAVEKVFELCR